MTTKNRTYDEFTTAEGRIVKPFLVEKDQIGQTRDGRKVGREDFHGTLIFAKSDPSVQGLVQTIAGIINAEWPQGAQDFKYQVLNSVLLDGDAYHASVARQGAEKAVKVEWQRGHYLIKAHSQFQPAMFANGHGDGPIDEVTAKRLFVSGCYGHFRIMPAAYDGTPGPRGLPPGVTLYLNSVLWTRPGAYIDAGGKPARASSAAEAFAGIYSGASNVDPTQGMVPPNHGFAPQPGGFGQAQTAASGAIGAFGSPSVASPATTQPGGFGGGRAPF